MTVRQQTIDPGLGWDAPFGCSQAVRAGDLLFLAGQTPHDSAGAVVAEGDIRGQSRQTFENIEAVLAAAGSGLDDIVEMIGYHTDMAELGGVLEVKGAYLSGDVPCRGYVRHPCLRSCQMVR